MKIDFTIREGNTGDITQLTELALLAWGQYAPELSETHWRSLKKVLTDENFFRKLLDQSYCLVVETAGRRIIGMVYLVPRGNPTEIYPSHWSYIRFLTVDPRYGGQGIGRKLTESCIQRAREDNEQYVGLHTSEMMTSARSLYESLGFTRLRELPPRLGKRYWLYCLSLVDGPS